MYLIALICRSKQNKCALLSSIKAAVLVSLLCPGSLPNPFDISVKSLHKVSTSVGTANEDVYQKVKLDNCGIEVFFCYLHWNFWSSLLPLACYSTQCHAQFYLSLFTSQTHPSFLIAKFGFVPSRLHSLALLRVRQISHQVGPCVIQYSFTFCFLIFGVGLSADGHKFVYAISHQVAPSVTPYAFTFCFLILGFGFSADGHKFVCAVGFSVIPCLTSVYSVFLWSFVLCGA